MVEMERRWKLKEYPQETNNAEIKIEQYYISDISHMKLRVRRSETLDETWYTHCVKYFIGENAREEIETMITVNQFERIIKLYPNLKKETKKRTVIQIDNDKLVAEVDEYENGDIVVEVEFYDVSQMANFTPPQWFGEEIKDKKFTKENKFSIW